MTREQLSIAGTEPERNPTIDEALFAWLNAKQEQRAASGRAKQWLGSLQTRCTQANVSRYPYTDPDTGKRQVLVIGAKIDMKTSKAPPERKGRGGKRGRAKGESDREQEGDVAAKAKSRTLLEEAADDPQAAVPSLFERDKAYFDSLDDGAEDRLAAGDAGALEEVAAGTRALEDAVTGRFRVGDRVTWTSQASGVEKRKKGEIVVVIPPGVLPGALYPRMAKTKRFDTTKARDHVSYGVEVDGEIYWPVAAKLKPAKLKPAKGKR